MLEAQCLQCSKPSKLRCPTCLKMGLKDSHFCSQDCFKESWKSHKAVHAPPPGTYNPWPNFSYTGSLRPVYPLSEKRVVKNNIAVPDYANHPQGYSLSEQNLRGTNKIKILDSSEIAKMKVACTLGREVLEIGAKAIRGKKT